MSNYNGNGTVGGVGGGGGLGFNNNIDKSQFVGNQLQQHSISFHHQPVKFQQHGGIPMNINSKAPALPCASNTSHTLNSVPGLNPDVELAVEWSPEEQSVLEDGLSKYGDEHNILKYIKISAMLPEKTVRDVALRCRWMTKKENGKRRKPEEYYTGKKMKDRKEKPESSSKLSTCSAPPLNMGAYSMMMHHRDQNDQILCEGMSGTTRHLLDENAQFFSHITANLAAFKIQENLDLFCRARNNISAIINDMRAMPGIMSQMPPLPVSINEELANIVLSHSVQTMIYCSPSTVYGKPPERR